MLKVTPERPLILPPVYFIATAAMMGLVARYLPIGPTLAPPASYIVGIVMIVAGIGVMLAGVAAFGRAHTPLVPFDQATALVTSGIFRMTRNPMYLGMVITLLGMAFLVGDAGAFLLAAAFFLVIQYRFVRIEEVYMEQLFGGEYLDYKKRVRRWI